MDFWVWLESSWIWECRDEPMKEVCVHVSHVLNPLWLCFKMLSHYVTHTLGWLLGVTTSLVVRLVAFWF